MTDSQGAFAYLGGVAICGFLLLFAAQGFISRSVFSLLAAAILAGGALFFFLLVKRSVESLRRYMAREGDGSYTPTLRTRAIVVPTVAMIAAALLVLVPEVVRIGSGWAENPRWTPPVVGPGDTARVEFPETVQTIGGNWAGTARVDSATAEGGEEIPGFSATAPAKDWDDSIRAKESRTELWAEVTVPDDPSLDGKTVRLTLSLDATYAEPQGSTSFQESTRSFEHTARLVLSSPGAGGTYGTLWWAGSILGLLGFFIAAACLLNEC